jgi:hypothetical protein
MGFLDKAKKLAEQAQTKIDEVQKDFNEKQGSGGNASPGNAVEYDEHGRAKTPETPQTPADLPATGSGELDKAVGDPLSAEGASSTPPPTPTSPDPAPGKVQGDPLGEEAEKKPPAPPSGGGLSSGDPLG